MISTFEAEKDALSPQVRSWFGAGVQTVASHAAVQALSGKWLQIRGERDPCLEDFWHDPPEALVNYTILFLKGDQDYTYMHHGRALRERIGFSMQGLRLGQLRTRVRTELQAIYDRATTRFEPAYFQSFADFQQDVILWGRLCLPLRISADDQRVALLIYCHPIEDKASMFRALFEHSATAILIATPVRDELGAIVDAWIIAENGQAARLTGLREHASANLLLRALPMFSSDDLWHHLVGGLDRGVMSALVSEQATGRTLRIEAEAVGEFIALRLCENGAPPAFIVA
ncbi:hypothetical protein [Salinarimonas soli]|uniref:PAS domain-containing protein n=1 Tax=Salinarimonas soli TaxID=1638099 RepID=A0A5B2V9S5_9HYPH|nr:hypothetical protein [Salinarimonas soli]KAA2235180.1 hypothetical protein F0L46_20760 [Salinarimonas soli]